MSTTQQSTTQHAAASTVKNTEPNDTKAIIEASTGVTGSSKQALSHKRLPVEVYPCLAPLSGVTFRIDRPSGSPALWLDGTLNEAKTLLKEMAAVINEIEEQRANEDAWQPDPETRDWRTPKGKEVPAVTPLEWFVGTHTKADPPENKDKVPVFNNRKDSPVVWFPTREAAEFIVERLNNR